MTDKDPNKPATPNNQKDQSGDARQGEPGEKDAGAAKEQEGGEETS